MLRQIHRYGQKLITFPFIVLIKLYQWLISPILGPRCRFYPTCSEYALTAFKTQPLPRALLLVLRRLVNCHPFGKSGYDPVPSQNEHSKPCQKHKSLK